MEKRLSETLHGITIANSNIDVDKAYASLIDTEFFKGGNKDFGSLGVMTKQVTRNGKTYNAKFYVDTPDKTKEKNMKNARETEKQNDKTGAAERAVGKKKETAESKKKISGPVMFNGPDGKKVQGKVKSVQNIGGREVATVVDKSGKSYIIDSSKLKSHG